MSYTGHPRAYRGVDTSASPENVWGDGTSGGLLQSVTTARTVGPVGSGASLTYPAGTTGVLFVCGDVASLLTWITVTGESPGARIGGAGGPLEFFTAIDPDDAPTFDLTAPVAANVNLLFFSV